MIDNFAILLSTAVIVYVMVRAVRLTRTTPWFERVPAEELRAASARRRGVRRDLRAELAEAALRRREAAPPAPPRRP